MNSTSKQINKSVLLEENWISKVTKYNTLNFQSSTKTIRNQAKKQASMAQSQGKIT
jgi:hypothetical protein